jgi:hypothetical protein
MFPHHIGPSLPSKGRAQAWSQEHPDALHSDALEAEFLGAYSRASMAWASRSRSM